MHIVCAGLPSTLRRRAGGLYGDHLKRKSVLDTIPAPSPSGSACL
jgi:hypothetical protein